MKNLSVLSKVALPLALSILVVGCGPRGESKTLDEVFADARSSYNGVSLSSVPAPVSESLKKVSGDLDRLAGIGGAGDAKEVAAGVANSLADLTPKCGFTVRPALAELVSQYRAVSGAESGQVSLGAPQLKLLASRTYTLLRGELTTTQFKL